MMLRVSLRVVEDPPDRPEWLRESVRLLADWTTTERGHLLALVAAAGEDELLDGAAEDWGLGQVATHLLIVERGVTLVGLRLAGGAEPGPTGQPRPDPAAVTREGIAALAAKAAAASERLVATFPAEPDMTRTARHPYYGELNCFGWLLMLPEHYRAHLEALDRGRPSAL